jgi:hypothetical protein
MFERIIVLFINKLLAILTVDDAVVDDGDDEIYKAPPKTALCETSTKRD